MATTRAGREWPPQAPPLFALALAGLAIPAGLAAELTGGAPLPVLDLAAGWALAAFAVVLVVAGRVRSGVLVATAALAWFAGTLWPDLIWVHRGALATAVLAAPDGHLTTSRSRIAAGVAWACALLPVPGPHGAVVTAAAAVAARPRSLPVLAFAGAIAWVPFARGVAPGAADATLAVYELTIVIPALLLAMAAVRARALLAATIVDLDTSAGLAGVQQALIDAVGDPALRLGRWSGDAAAFVDVNLLPLEVPLGEPASTPIARDGAPFGLLVHAPGALSDRRLRSEVVRAARLALENADLQSELESHATAVRDSRRRLVTTGTRQRGLLSSRLTAGPVRRLDALAPFVADLPRAAELLDDVRRDLETLGRGLLPEGIERGDLAGALSGISAGTALVVTVEVNAGPLDRATAAALYFVAVEGVANAARHAQAMHARIAVERALDRVMLEVWDDGVGGADPTGGGLQGLRDRIEALGGTLQIVSTAELGTRLRAELPAT